MEARDIAELGAATEALNERDVEPLVALMDADMVWEGARRGWLWWRQRPS